MPTVEDRLKLDAGADLLDDKIATDTEDEKKPIRVPVAVAGAVVIMYLQGAMFSVAAVFMGLFIGAGGGSETEEFEPYPPRMSMADWQQHAGGGPGGEGIGSALIVLLIAALAVMFILTATMLTRLEWRGVAVALEAALAVPVILFTLVIGLPAGLGIAVGLICVAVFLLLRSRGAERAIEDARAAAREQRFDVRRVVLQDRMPARSRQAPEAPTAGLPEEQDAEPEEDRVPVSSGRS